MVLLFAGVAQWLEFQPSKLAMRVRFPSPAPLSPSNDASSRAPAQVVGDTGATVKP